MTAHRLAFASRRLAGFAGLFVLMGFAPASAQSRYPDILPLNRVKTGMKGYGLSTFRGNTISRFDVTVIGTLSKVNNGRDLILIRIENGPVALRGANLVQGMSGSPIYINGKVIGAISQGEGFQKEPLNMVTPIEDMLEAWDPNIPQQPEYFKPQELDAPRAARANKKARWTPDERERSIQLPQPLQIGSRRIARLTLNARADRPRSNRASEAVFYRAATQLSVNGLRERERAWLQKELEAKGYNITVGSGLSGGGGSSAPATAGYIRPGAAFGAFLATGDIRVGATGTVTYVKGNRFLGFGHPFFGLGALEAAVTTATILDIMPGYQVSHHIAVTGATVGTLTQDRDFSISAHLGKIPRTVPFEVTVRDRTNRRTQIFRTELFQHPDLTGVLMRLVARQALAVVHNVPGDVMVKTTTTVEANEVGSITRSSVAHTPDDPGSVATQDLTEIANIISANPFYPLPVRSAKMNVEILPGRNTATVERIFLKQGRYEPGETVEIGVVLKPHRSPAQTRAMAFRLPANIPAGRHILIVRGGAPTVTRIGPFTVTSGGNEPQSPPANIGQMVQRLNEQPKNTDLLARLQLTTASPAVEGERLSPLPPYLNALMRSDRNSALRLERDEIRATMGTEFVVSGLQQLQLNVVRRNIQEPGGGNNMNGGGNSSAPGGGVAPINVGVRTSSGASDDDLSAPASSENSAIEDEAPLRLAPEVRLWISALDEKKTPQRNDGKKAPAPPKPEAKTENAQPTAAPTQAAPAQPAPPPPPDYSNERPVGRTLQTWRQVARTDFASGRFYGTSVAGNGELRLAPTLNRLVTTNEIYLWSLASDAQGNLYAGTGTGGAIVQIDRAGNLRPLAKLPVLSVQSLLLAKDGALYAGGAIPGNLFKVTLEGKVTQLGVLTEKVITALAQDSRGALYLASGTSGTVYRLAAGQNAPQPFATVTGDYVTSLALDSQDNLYASVGGNGVLYKITPDGKSEPLYDTRGDSIMAVAVDANGKIYFGTGPRGGLYRLNADGGVTTLLDRTTGFITGLRALPDGTLLATSVGAVYRLLPQPDGTVAAQSFDNPKEVDFLSTALLPDGRIAVGTGNVGEVYVAPMNPAAGGAFESVVRDARIESHWGSARWNAALPSGASVRVQTRSGESSEPDANWSPWQDVTLNSAVANEGRIVSPMARFLQYRLTLSAGANGKTPAVRDVSLTYLPRNQAPRIAFQAPAGGERWNKTQTARWNANDPDNDTLTYQVFYSADNGATWKPLPAAKPDAKSAAPATPPGTPAPPAPMTATNSAEPLSLEELQKRMDSEPNMPESLKKVILEGARRRIAAMNLLTTGAPATANAPASSRENSRAFDTAILEDGVYVLKVVATDQSSNPIDPLTAQAISETFVVCNAVPEIRVSSQPIVGPDKSAALEGSVRQKLVSVTAVQYRIDGGDWTAAVPKDGLFDSLQEEFAFASTPLSPGKHTIEILAFNAAGGRSVEKMTVEVK